MTHIHDDIRLDSLKFFQLWLQAFPSLLVQTKIPVLPSFLSLLSNVNLKGSNSQMSFRLIANPSGKLGSASVNFIFILFFF